MSEAQPGQTPIGSPYSKAPPPRKRPAWRTLLWIALAIVAAVVLIIVLTPHSAPATGGKGGHGGRGGAGGRRPPTVVGTAIAAPGDMPIQLDALGTVTPEATVIVQSRISGTLMKVYFREGQMVRAGELLAEIDPRPYVIAQTQAEGQLLRDDAALDDARLDLKRYQTLLSQDSIASQQVDTQKALVKQDEGVVRSDQASLANAKLNLVYCRITSPVAGRIGLRAVDAGNYITPAATNGVATVTAIDPIDVVFTLAEDSVPQVNARIATGAVLSVTAYDRAGSAVLGQGVLATLDNQIDTSTGTVKAKARFDNPVGALYPNQFVNARLLVDTLHGAIIIPTAAVRHGPNGDFVYTVDDPTVDPTAKMTTIKLGPADGERTAVLSGLQAGDMVITEGGDRLSDGATVILPGHAPQTAAKPKPTGVFGWLSGLFGKKPAGDQSISGGSGGADQGAAATGSAPAPGAGGPGGGGAGRGARMQAMLAQLDLDADQQAKVKAIQAEVRQKVAAAAPGDTDAFRVAMRDANDKIKVILRPDQLAKFNDLRAKMRGNRGGGGAPDAASAGTPPPAGGQAATPANPSRPGPATPSAPAPADNPGGGGHEGGGRMARVTQALDLDADQQAKAQAIFAAAREQAQASSDPDARHQAMAAAFGKLDAILRPDQKTKLAAMRANMGGGGGGHGGGNE